jgi:hypothetical protein
MTNRYYLLEGVQKPHEIGVNFATYSGERHKTKGTLDLEATLFDSGEFGIRELRVEKRNGKRYTHLVVDGDTPTFTLFEQYVEGEGAHIRGSRETQENSSIDELALTYLPSTQNKMATCIKTCKKYITPKKLACLVVIATMYASTQSYINHKQDLKKQQSDLHAQYLEVNPKAMFTIVDSSRASESIRNMFEEMKMNNPNRILVNYTQPSKNYWGVVCINISGNYRDTYALHKSCESLRPHLGKLYVVGDIGIVEEGKKQK